MHPLHFGTLWGLPFKILWFLLGLSLALLTATGLLMYWNRYLRKRWHTLTHLNHTEKPSSGRPSLQSVQK
jgi:uncharacterized iron-regulated membrane protein